MPPRRAFEARRPPRDRSAGWTPCRPLAATLALAILFAGCSGEPTRSPEAAAKSTAVGTTIADLSGVNELIAGDVQFTTDILDQLFVQLMSEQADFTEHPPTLAPELATGYDWSEDRLRLTFHLRTDAVWSDGVPITAEDVRWTWQA